MSRCVGRDAATAGSKPLQVDCASSASRLHCCTAAMLCCAVLCRIDLPLARVHGSGAGMQNCLEQQGGALLPVCTTI